MQLLFWLQNDQSGSASLKIRTFLSMDKGLKREIKGVTENSEPFNLRVKSSFLLKRNKTHFFCNRYFWEISKKGGLEHNFPSNPPHGDEKMMRTEVRQQQQQHNSVVYNSKRTRPL